jgi:hypothetical protein
MAEETKQKARRISTSEARAIEGVWSNRDFLAMPAEKALAWLYVLTGPHTEGAAPGLFRLTVPEICDGLDGPNVERVTQYIEDFVQLGWLKVDAANGLMRVVGVIVDVEDDELSTPALKALDSLPNCQLVWEYRTECVWALPLDD